MAKRRMFSLDVVDTDMFLDLPLTSQALYFHLAMRADDKGFISSPKRIVRLIGCGEDDLNILITRHYVIPFPHGVVERTDWNVNNWIRPDRMQETRYLKELEELSLENGVYLKKENVNQMSTKRQPNDNQKSTKRHTQVRLGKDSIVKGNSSSLDKKIKGPLVHHPSKEKEQEDQKANQEFVFSSISETSHKSKYQLPSTDGLVSLDERYLMRLFDVYPMVNLSGELTRMADWFGAHPDKVREPSKLGLFISNWLKDASERKTAREPAAVEDPADEDARRRGEVLDQMDREAAESLMAYDEGGGTDESPRNDSDPA